MHHADPIVVDAVLEEMPTSGVHQTQQEIGIEGTPERLSIGRKAVQRLLDQVLPGQDRLPDLVSAGPPGGLPGHQGAQLERGDPVLLGIELVQVPRPGQRAGLDEPADRPDVTARDPGQVPGGAFPGQSRDMRPGHQREPAELPARTLVRQGQPEQPPGGCRVTHRRRVSQHRWPGAGCPAPARPAAGRGRSA